MFCLYGTNRSQWKVSTLGQSSTVCSTLQTTTECIKECELTTLNFILDTYFKLYSITLVTHILNLTFALHIIINFMVGIINFSEQKIFV